MSWILLSCIPPFLWAFNNIFDEYLAKSAFAKAGALFIFLSAVFELIAAFGLFAVVPHVLNADFFSILVMMGLGFMLTSSFVPYIHSLQEDNAGNAVPIYQTIPVFVFVLAFVFLEESATLLQIFAAALIIVSSIMVGFDLKTKSINKKAVLLMLLSSLLIAVFSVLAKFFITEQSWQTFAFWSWIGSGLGSVLLIVSFAPWRRVAFKTMKAGGSFILAVFVMQVGFQAGAIAVWYKAISIGPSIALIQTIGGLQPAFILILSIIAGFFSLSIFPKVKYDRYLSFKFFMVGLIIYGVYLLSL